MARIASVSHEGGHYYMHVKSTDRWKSAMSNTALITGTSSGVGLEFAHIHGKKGGDLILVARSETKLENLAQ